MVDNRKVILKDWINVNLKDIVVFQEGPGLTSDLFKETGFPFLNIRCIENGKINKSECQFISNEIANSIYKHFQLEEDDLIMSTSGTLGKKAFVKKIDLPLLLNTSIIRFKPKNPLSFNLEFLNYLLEDNDFISELYNQSTGSAQINVGPSHLRKISVTIPQSYAEQCEIAAILSKLDKAIEQTEQLIKKYKQIKTGLMHDLLTRGIDENGNIRSEETHKFKDSPLGRIPDEWECITIGDIIEQLRSGITPKGGSEVYQKEGVMLIRSQNVYPHGFKLDDVAYISDKINSRMLGSELKELDILLNITGASIGRSTFVPVGFPKANVNQHVCSIRIKEPNMERSIFVSSFLNSSFGQNQINQHNAGSNRQGLNYSQIKQIYIPYFNNEYEFVNFSKSINRIDKTINLYAAEAAKLQSLKSGLMQDLLTGKVRVSICEEQKESVSNINSIKAQTRNQHIEDAVLIAAIVNAFYSDKYPLGRKKIQKLLYLVRRHQEASIACFKKKAAGPYADEVRYKGGEPIAKTNKYIVTKTNSAGTVFSKGENIGQALAYIEKWDMQSDIEWLISQFKYTKVDQLELIATIDMARCDLEKEGIPVSLSTVKHLIATNKEWKEKLKKNYFDDLNIQRGIDESYKLFGE